MKHVVLISFLLFAPMSFAGDCIIDPNKVVYSSSAPVFIPRDEDKRAIASEKGAPSALNVSSPDQYLDVQRELHTSEPTVSRVWLERRILNEAE